jgi:ATP synthase F1 gamma subunit
VRRPQFIVKEAKAQARALIAAGKTVTFYLVGKKGRAPLRRDYPKAIAENFDTSTVRTPGFDEASAIAHQILAMFEAGKFDVAHLVAPKFKSALAQDPVTTQIIPVPAPPPRLRPTRWWNTSRARRKSSRNCCRATSPRRCSARCWNAKRPNRARR